MDGFSKLMLGTVQFGMNYGVANTTGKPSFEAVKTILKAAYDGGVTALDTAPEYGDSEEVIGRALDELGLAGCFRIVTKIPKLPEGRDAEKFIAESLENSLRRLRIERVDAALLHAEEDFIYLDALKSMVGRGLTAAAGVSLNTAAHRADGDAADCLQVPASLLDRRFDGCFGKGRHVFVRGAYLQGMLLMPEEKVFITEVLARRRELEKLGLPMAELALRYLFSKPEPKSILTGVETVAQLEENIRIAALPPLDDDDLRAVDAIAFPEIPEMCVSPYFWPQYKKLRNIK
jgi:aryl-alcohol dehydrogenase-like predicted oxidoreductase